jgi:hypothetical protein
MQLLKDEWEEADIIAALLPDLPKDQPEHRRQSTNNTAGLVVHPNGQYHFIISPYKRCNSRQSSPKGLLQLIYDPSPVSKSGQTSKKCGIFQYPLAHLSPKMTRLLAKMHVY